MKKEGTEGRERRRANAPSGAEKSSEKSKFSLTIQLICPPTSYARLPDKIFEQSGPQTDV